MVHGQGHRGSQHANPTKLFGSDLRNLLNWMLAATVLVRVTTTTLRYYLCGYEAPTTTTTNDGFENARPLNWGRPLLASNS